MKQSVKRLLSSALALLLVVAAFVIFLNGLQPLYAEVSGIKGQVLGQSALVDREQKVIQEVQKLVSVYEKSQDLRDGVSEALPPAPELAQALAQLNGLAGINHLAAQAYSLSVPVTALPDSARRDPSKPGQGGLIRPLSSVLFQIKLVGAYEDFQSFLKNLEGNMRVMDVRSFSVQPATGGTAKGPADLFQYDLTVATYYQMPQK